MMFAQCKIVIFNNIILMKKILEIFRKMHWKFSGKICNFQDNFSASHIKYIYRYKYIM